MATEAAPGTERGPSAAVRVLIAFIGLCILTIVMALAGINPDAEPGEFYYYDTGGNQDENDTGNQMDDGTAPDDEDISAAP